MLILADLALRSDRPYSVVATVVHHGGARRTLAQLDLHLTTGNVRLRFLDRASLGQFVRAVVELASQEYLPASGRHPDVWTRLYSDDDPADTAPVELPLALNLFV